MAKPYEISITIDELNETVRLSGEFDDDEWRILNSYSDYSMELSQVKLLQEGFSSNLSIKGSAEGLSITSQLPDWDNVMVFLYKLRPFVLKNEATYFFKVCNILNKQITDPFFHQMVTLQRNLFGGKVMQAQFSLSVNNIVVNSETMLFNWLNAHEYHRDIDKQELIANLHELFPLDASKVLFLHLLTDKATAILAISNLIQVILGYQNRIILPGKKG